MHSTELDKLGWIKEVPDSERNQQLAEAYLASLPRGRKTASSSTALVVSPTHAEGDRITAGDSQWAQVARQTRQGTQVVTAWVSRT